MMLKSIIMSKLSDAIKEARVKTGLTQERVAEIIGESHPNYNSMENGRRSISRKTIEKLSRIPGYPLSKEEMLYIKALDKTPELESIGPPQGFYPIPCKGSVTAGALELAEETQDVVYFQWMDPTVYSGDMFCLKIKGDSMEPEFHDGGIILVRPARAFQNNRYYVVQTENGETTFKVLRMESHGAKLVPINKKYKPIKVEDFHIEKAFEVLEYKKSYI